MHLWLWLLFPATTLADDPPPLEAFSSSSVVVAVGQTLGRVEALRSADAGLAAQQAVTRCESWRDETGNADPAGCVLVSHCVRPGFFAVARGRANDQSWRIGVACGSPNPSEARVSAETACREAGADGCEMVPSSLHEI